MNINDIRRMALALEAVKGKKLDPAGKHDKDIDNDGDHDKSDKYLIKRRGTVKKAMGRDKNNTEVQVQESVEELDELSANKLNKYRHKIAPELNKNQPGDPAALKKRLNREKGDKLAMKKMIRHKVRVPATEGAEQIDEISYRDSGYSNMLKASRKADKEADKVRAQNAKAAGNKSYAKGQKMIAKIRNESVLTKEETDRIERIDELSKKTLGSYVKKAVPDSENRVAKGMALTVTGHNQMARGDVATASKTFDKSSDEFDKGNKRKGGISKAVDRLTKEGLEEGYKEVDARWIAKVTEVANEIAEMAEQMASDHIEACAASERIDAAYRAGTVPSAADHTLSMKKAYDVKYLVRQLEDVRDSLEQKIPTAVPSDAVAASPKRYYESVNPEVRKPISIRDALGMMESRQNADAYPAETIDDKFSGSDKNFIAVHKTTTPDESNIDAAINKNSTEVNSSLQRAQNFRSNDQKIGDKAMPTVKDTTK